MLTKTKAIANAFKTVSADSGYRGRWILDSDYAAIIRLEYGLQSEHGLSYIFHGYLGIDSLLSGGTTTHHSSLVGVECV
jgi:hypothetical protein